MSSWCRSVVDSISRVDIGAYSSSRLLHRQVIVMMFAPFTGYCRRFCRTRENNIINEPRTVGVQFKGNF
jgi:hypothetical protein